MQTKHESILTQLECNSALHTRENFIGVKINLGSNEQADLIQEHLFTLGFDWMSGKEETVKKLGGASIFIQRDGVLNYCTCDKTFQESSLQELEFKFGHKQVMIPEITAMRQAKPPRPTTRIGGTEYFTDDLEKALSLLTPVKIKPL